MIKKAFFTLLIGSAFFIGTTACGGETNEETTVESTEVEESHEGHNHDAESTESVELAYYCPMECEGDKTYEETGSCPVCGMDLVEKH